MTEQQRREAANKFRSLLDRGVLRKAAVLQVLSELRQRELPASRSSLYNWCARFGVSTR